jgi:GTP-binding protein
MLPGARIVDCPGYGFAKSSQEERQNWRKFMEIYLNEALSLHKVIVLVDLNSGLQSSDKSLMDVLIDMNQPFSLVLTKADKCKSKFVYSNAEKAID